MRREMISLNGLETPVTITGSGTHTIVLLHGGPGAFDYLESLSQLLPETWQAVRYDQRGGGQVIEPGPYSVAQLVEDLEALREQLQLQSWVVAGHSWGAFLALAYAVRYPEPCQALIQIGGTGLDPDWQKAYHTNRRKILSPVETLEILHLRQERGEACAGKNLKVERRLLELNLKADFADPANLGDLPDLLMSYLYAQDVCDQLINEWQMHLLDTGFRRQVAALKMPVLCLHGSADPRPATGSRTLGEFMKQGQYQEIEAAGHYPWLEQPETVKTLLSEFLNNLTAGNV